MCKRDCREPYSEKLNNFGILRNGTLTIQVTKTEPNGMRMYLNAVDRTFCPECAPVVTDLLEEMLGFYNS